MSEEAATTKKTRSYVDAARKNKGGEEEQSVGESPIGDVPVDVETRPQRRGRKPKSETGDMQTSAVEEPVQEDNRPQRYERQDRYNRQDRQDQQPYHTDDDLEQMSREEMIETIKKQDRIINALQRRRQQPPNRYYNNSGGPRNNYRRRDNEYGDDNRQSHPQRYDNRRSNNGPRPGGDSHYTPERFRERFPNRHDRQEQQDEARRE